MQLNMSFGLRKRKLIVVMRRNMKSCTSSCVILRENSAEKQSCCLDLLIYEAVRRLSHIEDIILAQD